MYSFVTPLFAARALLAEHDHQSGQPVSDHRDARGLSLSEKPARKQENGFPAERCNGELATQGRPKLVRPAAAAAAAVAAAVAAAAAAAAAVAG